MKAVNTKNKRIMDFLTSKPVKSNKFEHNGYMPLCVENMGSCELGDIYSLAHYYEQNGDLMRDPDVEFIKAKDGNYYPISYRQDNLGINQNVVEFDDNFKLIGVAYKQQIDIAIFCNTWIRNINEQFKLGVK